MTGPDLDPRLALLHFTEELADGESVPTRNTAYKPLDDKDTKDPTAEEDNPLPIGTAGRAREDRTHVKGTRGNGEGRGCPPTNLPRNRHSKGNREHYKIDSHELLCHEEPESPRKKKEKEIKEKIVDIPVAGPSNDPTKEKSDGNTDNSCIHDPLKSRDDLKHGDRLTERVFTARVTTVPVPVDMRFNSLANVTEKHEHRRSFTNYH